MTVCCTPLFEIQLKALLAPIAASDPRAAKSAKLYLDTVMMNLPSKAHKYKPSRYFDDERIRDALHQEWVIPFYYDASNDAYVILGIAEKNEQSLS